MSGLQYVKAALGCQELKLYFAVPENIYESFQKQPYHTQKGTEWKKKRDWYITVGSLCTHQNSTLTPNSMNSSTMHIFS